MHRRPSILLVLAAALIATSLTLAYVWGPITGRYEASELPEPLRSMLKDKSRAIHVVVEGLEPGGVVPVEYTCDARHYTEPRISWSPYEPAKAYMVIVVDPDAPSGLFIHLLVYDGSATRWPAPGYKVGINSANEPAWYPVCPPKGHGTHHYYFIVIALSEPLGLPTGADFNKVLAAANDKILAYGYVVGVYERR
ncbi:PEBP family protein [Pyrolobus fumarii 1A]|uniref:PEBP family protein n=1 Tax=Pyrolobus fumarii (strain DSM 11204 / 1A) TaxID=694429 RepID=G0EE70_PYRF1|nr:YbhB/YbcL family Raf kinase inhibitor-like protein [Pyrolobus fumarii]AEM38764.1 PEBP family protein [Pyrolobus fumarii 1A]